MKNKKIMKKIDAEIKYYTSACEKAAKGKLKRSDFITIGDISDLIGLYLKLKKDPKDGYELMWELDSNTRDFIPGDICEYFGNKLHDKA